MQDFGSAQPEQLLSRFGKRFTAGQVIFREGEPASEAYLLQEGRVRLIKRVRTVERSLHVLHAGDLFGESGLLTGSPRWSTAIALSEVQVLAVDPATLQSLVASDAATASQLVQQLVKRIRGAEDQIEILMLRDTPSKIVRALLTLAEQAAQDPTKDAVLQITPLELSTLVGLDVDTVKRGVQKLRDSQYLRVVDETIAIPDLESLRRLFSLLGVKDEIEGAHPAHVSFTKSRR
jgi:CRP/FNR family cyclic AMP-dependent transcriptional regulator